jgi:hypothetical protein
MGNGSGGMSARARLDVCLACGGPMEEPLRRLGSLRCLDCRAARRPLDPQVVDVPDELGDAFRTPAGLFWRVRSRQNASRPMLS